jgi:hypothetical protein
MSDELLVTRSRWQVLMMLQHAGACRHSTPSLKCRCDLDRVDANSEVGRRTARSCIHETRMAYGSCSWARSPPSWTVAKGAETDAAVAGINVLQMQLVFVVSRIDAAVKSIVAEAARRGGDSSTRP